MKLIIGLGNPGPDYERSRHNIGFMVLERIKSEIQSEEFKHDKKFKASVSRGEYDGEQVILAKPLTYMNLSGESVLKIAQFFKISPADIIVIYDDLDLPVGKMRIKTSGGAGTHNGMKSVVSCLGKDFIRIRVGIEGRPEALRDPEKTADYVLGRFGGEEAKTISASIENACVAVKMLISGDTDSAMNKFN